MERYDNTQTQRIKLTKQEKKEAKYERRKQKLKHKKDTARARLTEKLLSVSHEDKLAFSANKKQLRTTKMENAMNAMMSNVRVCIDLGFNDVNSPREQRSLVKQCTLAYAAIRNSTHGIALHISSLEGDVLSTLQAQGVDQWHIRRHEKSVFDVFERDEIVMLSPDAEDVLQEIDQNKIYVVGGIVDRTVRNNLTLDKALDEGVSAKRLPVKEFFPHAQSHVINIDQVVAMFCLYEESTDWQVAMERVIPARRRTHNNAIVSASEDVEF
eukprot:CAMPEP_0114418386 /NCGR_PEP_ID=MMETSP0103-20121206/3468_1 /TAXON_ID=37642 ORGANISM="Paraphysomonas imperforata, Strain PA2" /NCGR_SAMPLE_ID=MMETSP0103 /ASSEMBLY_ACC=CAM_ASM_000201 /LENGTH=268 /DNA_ID=CAMNT_0001586739 /DNA_START=108 /DNA_END=914 /DNA_ORIENTATION=+